MSLVAMLVGLPSGGLGVVGWYVYRVYGRHKDSDDLLKSIDKCAPTDIADVVRAHAELRAAGRLAVPRPRDNGEKSERGSGVADPAIE